MISLEVDLGDRSYPIIIGSGALVEIAKYIPANQNKLFIVTDENLEKFGHLQSLKNQLTDKQIEIKILPAGEQTKSFENLQLVTEWLLSHKVERGSTVIALGGGVIGDLVGFAASVTLRGINFIQLPTTLLSQVDSSVGGKTAINSKHGKNLIGAFYQPKQVIIDIEVLKTLPKREFLSGYAEVIKYGLIDDEEFFNWLDENLLEDEKNLIEAIERSCRAKAKIVAEDEKEKGKRALLNLGHTFGHAFEAETGFSDKLLHGEAVALGTIMAFKFSNMLGLCDEVETQKVIAHFDKIGLPTEPKKYLDEWNVDKLISHMYSDKKVSNGKLVFVLVNAIGDAEVVKEVDEAKVREFLERI